ncbi:hypothetical protein Pyn_33806 [Prunus yedoensis var. nudiflora]|uniref:Uncharacterized protein n=1 Tax=Prunus yedoensis var. nudiflora TaxID=2094558 RepID=A0A314XS97_PRUYE|nr:hypothetical protein Pyn_33806 [Prunus yedoensis var. nudiflora]
MGMKNPTSPSIDSRNYKEERAYLVNHLKGQPQMHQERRNWEFWKKSLHRDNLFQQRQVDFFMQGITESGLA